MADSRPPNLQEDFKRYAIGPFELDVRGALLCVRGEPLALGPRVVATLAALSERAGELVTKDELLDRVWAGEDVNESNVAQSVYTLRKVFREHGLDAVIATVPRRGYRLTAPVRLLPENHLPARRRERVQRWITLGRVRGWLPAALGALLIGAVAVPAAQPVRPPQPLSARGAELYKLARYYWNLRTPAGLAKSARMFDAVIASDPGNPLGYAGRADADLMTADYERERVKPARYYADARAQIRTALSLDPRSAAAHASFGMLRFAADRDPRGSEAEFRRAIELDPGYAIAHHWYGTTLLQKGRLLEASRELHIAVSLEPVSPATGGWLAEASYYSGRYNDAITYARLALDLDPHRLGALRCMGLAYELAGDSRRAIATFERMRRSGSETSYAPALLAEAYARIGRGAEARVELRLARKLHPYDGDTALAMLALGERTAGLAILRSMHWDQANIMLPDPRVAPFRAALRDAPHRSPHAT